MIDTLLAYAAAAAPVALAVMIGASVALAAVAPLTRTAWDNRALALLQRGIRGLEWVLQRLPRVTMRPRI